MAKILLVEPNYRSKFPPLGLLKISSYHKSVGDEAVFVRGKVDSLIDSRWDKVYVSSLFTWELPATVDALKFYSSCVKNANDLVVGGVGATLMPELIKSQVKCRVVRGPLNRANMIARGVPAIDTIVPDYSLIAGSKYDYQPSNSFFARTTQGCIRKCSFCAVCKIEPRFYHIRGWWKRIDEAVDRYGERRNLVLLDNNVLAARSHLPQIIGKVASLGFQRGAKLNNKRRQVDFNQGIDARLVNDRVAPLLASINLEPVRLALDTMAVRQPYSDAIKRLAKVGFRHFTNYVMYNFDDTPADFYTRLAINFDLSNRFGVTITGFPMRFEPIDQPIRGHVSSGWTWKYLRGVRCILRATYGLVTTNRDFFLHAFGSNAEEFLEIISMPDKYIIYRQQYADNAARVWKRRFRGLSDSSKQELLSILGRERHSPAKKVTRREMDRFGKLLEHYYSDKSLRIG